ncbi:HD domain-containing protein [Zavarzinia sp.]|uniref:HD domain-containing protein n=1 Tax=Zavarzinia sp. TaxID=2027920 RepID=UPI003567C125
MIQRKDIESVFGPVLELIGNAELRRKVVDAWMLAIERGGWKSMEHLRAMPFTLQAETGGVNFIEHTLAVTRGAVALAEAQEQSYAKMPYIINKDRLVAGGLLHDLGKLVEIERRPDGTHGLSACGRRLRHPISGSLLAAEAGLPDDVINTIACHSKEGEGAPKFIETVLIHQADFATFDPLAMRTKGLLIG